MQRHFWLVAGLCLSTFACGTSSSSSGIPDGTPDGATGGASDGGSSGGDGGADSGGGGDSGALAACSSYCIPSAWCSGNTCNPPSQCDTDNDCPATDKVYSANGPRCLAICGDHRRCRKPCKVDDDCKPAPTSTANTCSGIADDGTRYCEIGLTACPTGVCAQYTTCWPSFRPGG